MIEYLLHVVLPFNTGAPAIAAAAASLDDHAFRRRNRELVQQERDFLYARLSEMGLTRPLGVPSQANFLLIIDPPLGAPALVDALLEQGIIVRPMAGFGLPNALRVTVGLPEHNQRFLEAMRAVLAGVSVARA
jgi:histidinol-phosphate aminotransferase